MLATKFVLVGDHYQLPPLVQVTNPFSNAFYATLFFVLTSAILYIQSFEARESGMGISLFWRLSEAHPQAISALRCQVSLFELYFFSLLSVANATYFVFSGRSPLFQSTHD